MKDSRGFGHRASGPGGPLDLGTIFDEIFEAARDFQNEFSKNYQSYGETCNNEHTDYYPNYSYPPMNVFMSADRTLIFEFALAGFDEKDISLSFQGDYMVFSALISQNTEEASPPGESIRYFKRRLKMKDIEKQKYFVPLDKYAQDKVKAVYKNGILLVTVPPKEEPDQSDGVKIEIVSED